jgi:hypothetical protein
MDDGHDLDSGGKAIPRNERLQVGSPQHGGESTGNVLGEPGHRSRPGRDSASRDAYLEPDLCFGPARLRTRVRKPKAESDRPPLVLWQCRHRRRGQPSKNTGRVPELAQVQEINHERQISAQPTTRFVQIHIDARFIRANGSMEKNVRAPRGIPFPPALELMAGRLLEPREFPTLPFDPCANRSYKRLESEDGLFFARTHFG